MCAPRHAPRYPSAHGYRELCHSACVMHAPYCFRPTIPHDGCYRPLLHDDIPGLEALLPHAVHTCFSAVVGEHAEKLEAFERLAQVRSGNVGGEAILGNCTPCQNFATEPSHPVDTLPR